MPCLSQAPDSRSKQRHYWARHQATTTDNIIHMAKSGNTYAFNTNELLNDLLMKLNMAVGFQGWSVPGCGLWTINSFPRRKHTMPYPTRAFGYFPGVASVGGVIVHKNRDANTPVKFCQAEILETAASIPAQTWAVHLPIPCRLRLLFERNRGNHRRAQQSVPICASNCESALYGICRAGRLENPLKSITRNARCSLKFNRFMEEKGYRPSFSARSIEHEPTSVTLSATSI